MGSYRLNQPVYRPYRLNSTEHHYRIIRICAVKVLLFTQKVLVKYIKTIVGADLISSYRSWFKTNLAPEARNYMIEDLKQLLRVQELDVEIRDLVKRRADAVGELEAIRKEVENDEKAIEEEKNRLMGSRVHIKELELEIADKKNHIDKYREQLFKVKNNKEYTALLHEVSKLEGDIRILEDRMLEYMEEAEVEDKTLDGVRSELEGARVKYQELEVKSGELMQRLGKEIAEKENEKAKEVSRLDPELYEEYKRIFSRKPDLAVVKVVNDTCGGCNMELRAQVVNDIHRGEVISRCESCGRFIYL